MITSHRHTTNTSTQLYVGDFQKDVCHNNGCYSDMENLEKWEGIFQSGNFEQTGKVRENDTKYWKIQGISEKYYVLFSVIFK